MAKNDNDEMLHRLNAVVDGAWSHVTPGTPDGFYVERFKKQLREAINPPAPESTIDTVTVVKADENIALPGVVRKHPL